MSFSPARLASLDSKKVGDLTEEEAYNYAMSNPTVAAEYAHYLGLLPHAARLEQRTEKLEKEIAELYDLLEVIAKVEKSDDEEVDDDTILSGIVCNKCQTVLPSLTAKEHLDINNPINKCPHVRDSQYSEVCDK